MPTLKDSTFNECTIINDFKEFSARSDVMLENRLYDILKDVKDKVYTRDLYTRD